MRVPLLDLAPQFDLVRKDLLRDLELLCESQQFILGDKVRRFEEQIEAFTGAAHAIGCASGTDALLLALMAIELRPGDEVITTSYTFFATAGSIARLGGIPVFVDIDPRTYTMVPEAIKKKITPRTRAVIPVHLFGQTALMEPILEIAAAHGLVVIEDACQAIGAVYKGKQAGTLGDMGCLSFYPSKNLGGFGDGGMVLTNIPEWAEKIRLLRVHGADTTYRHRWIGINSRLDAIQAVVLSRKLPHITQWIQARRENADYYNKAFAQGPVGPPGVTPGCIPTYNQYVVRCPGERDQLKAYLERKEIGTAVYYPIPLHLQECFSYLGYRKGDLPESETASQQTLALPIYPGLTQEQLEYVVDTIYSFYGETG